MTDRNLHWTELEALPQPERIARLRQQVQPLAGGQIAERKPGAVSFLHAQRVYRRH